MPISDFADVKEVPCESHIFKREDVRLLPVGAHLRRQPPIELYRRIVVEGFHGEYSPSGSQNAAKLWKGKGYVKVVQHSGANDDFGALIR